MKTNYIYMFAGLWLMVALTSCKEFLNTKPLNIISDEDVFKDESLILSYLATLYDALPMDNFGNAMLGPNESIGGTGSGGDFWGYNHIRRVNALLEKLPASPLNENLKTTLIGEAKFLRAYYYFGMVKRYGGVPIIKSVQQYTGEGDISVYQVPRDEEVDVYNFIYEDLAEAATLLPETNSKGRATKFSALALQSRAMLYAGSSAKYAPVQLNGLVGIPESEQNRFWQSAFDAAEAIINSRNFSLYQQQTDLAENFAQLFLDDSNPEAIFIRYYSYPEKTHNYDRDVIPFGVRGPDGYGSGSTPVLEFVEQFELKDGSPGALKIGTPNAPVFYDHPMDLFADHDPRLLGTVILPASLWRGEEIDIQAGLFDQGVKIESGDPNVRYNPATKRIDANGTIKVVGSSGFGSEKTQTGFYLRKYLDNTLARANVRTNGSSQHWIALRYGEVLLNYAEAAIELGKIAEAKEAMNEIRSRAGISVLTDEEVTLDRVRHERVIELGFESHSLWDYKRWRLTDRLYNNSTVGALKCYFDIQANAYRFETSTVPNAFKTFVPTSYYTAIPASELTANPNLIQNPGY
ncbi:membrane protein [Parapedobacter defluvii]|uniref:Membrane protein n=1 Tax=Parapedobacter defluvii TaxID=2045106 RepID=A0ABQ1L5H7_9SPHI|nr:RagB/SusD family nutrient uptake outer membrane protein [Parapedobacter defluvii]RQP16109.1 MAG: RagB/SusD family nutrient uptake outer membrane protein [Parapedobacter sp.]GGC16832.1 membrane protein [Parapedobacter defluvii]